MGVDDRCCTSLVVCSYVIHVCKMLAVTIMAPKVGDRVYVFFPPGPPAPPNPELVQDLIYYNAIKDLEEKWVLPPIVGGHIYKFLRPQ